MTVASTLVVSAIAASLLLPTGIALAAAPAATGTLVTSGDLASLEILMGSQILGGSQRGTITENSVNSWGWIDATSDRTKLLTSATTPTGVTLDQTPTYNTLSDQYYWFQNPNYVRNPSNTLFRPSFNQGNPTAVGSKAIDWASGGKLPGNGGFLAKIAIYNADQIIVPNALFRLQLLGLDETSPKQFKVLGNGTGSDQFAPANAKPSFTFFNCDPSASSTCAPLAAADTPGGKNPTFDAVNSGAGESYAQTNSAGFAYVWVTMAGTAASNLYDFQLRVSDGTTEGLALDEFPAALDYSAVFPAFITSGEGFTPTSVTGSVVARTVPWAATAAGKDYASQSTFRLTSSCLWGSTLADPGSATSTIATTPKVAGTGNATLTVSIKNRCGNAMAGQKITVVKPDGTRVVLTTNGSGVATTPVTDTGSPWTGNFPTYLGDYPTGSLPDPYATPSMTYTAPPVATGSESGIVIDDTEDPADGSSPSTITVTVRDQFGNPVPAGTSVCLAIKSGDGTLSSGPWTTNASGQVTAVITAPTTTGTTVINGKLGTCASPGENIGDVSIDFVPGPASAGQSDIEVDEPEQNADGESESIVKVTVRDAHGNPVGAGVPVCLTGSGDGTMGTGPWVTDANGQVTTTVTAPTTPGSATINATLGTCDAPGVNIGSVDVNFVPGPPDAGESTVVIDDSSQPADGSSESTITVTILDANGNPVPEGTEVCLAITNGDGTLATGPWHTDASGHVTTTITAPTTAGTTTINASLGACGSSGESMGDVDVEFIPGPPDTTNSGIVVDETNIPADGRSLGTVVITIRDAFGNPVAAGTPVCLALESGDGTLGTGPWITNEFGQVTTTITAPSAPGSAVIGGTLGTCDAPGDPIGTVTVTFVDPYVPPAEAPGASGATLASTGSGDLGLPLALAFALVLVGVSVRRRRRVQ